MSKPDCKSSPASRITRAKSTTRRLVTIHPYHSEPLAIRNPNAVATYGAIAHCKGISIMSNYYANMPILQILYNPIIVIKMVAGKLENGTLIRLNYYKDI